jgi:hypothetical protein
VGLATFPLRPFSKESSKATDQLQPELLGKFQQFFGKTTEVTGGLQSGRGKDQNVCKSTSERTPRVPELRQNPVRDGFVAA